MEKEEKKTKYMVKLKAMLKVKTDAEKIKSEHFMPLKTKSSGFTFDFTEK